MPRFALAQTLSNIEIICIDDGSTDASGAMLDGYAKKDPRVKVIHKQNSGYGASMNRGLDAATGEFIGILESDDTMLSNGLEVLFNAAKKHGANVVKGNFNFYWSAPNEKIEPFPLVLKEECGRLVDVIEEPRIFHQKPSIWSGLYNREFLVQNGIRFLETPARRTKTHPLPSKHSPQRKRPRSYRTPLSTTVKITNRPR